MMLSALVLLVGQGFGFGVGGFFGQRIDRQAAHGFVSDGIGVQRDEQIGAGVVGQVTAFGEAQRHVAVAGQDHFVAAGVLEPRFELARGRKRDDLFVNARDTDSAGIDAAVAGIDRDHLLADLGDGLSGLWPAGSSARRPDAAWRRLAGAEFADPELRTDRGQEFLARGALEVEDEAGTACRRSPAARKRS